MKALHYTLLAATLLAVAPMLHAAPTESSITKQLQNLRSVPTDKRPAATLQLALDIRTLPAGMPKLKLADALCHLSTEGDAGADTLQAVADTLAKSLAETPIPAKGDQPPMPYFDLARLVRYEHVSATLDDPLYAKAADTLAANDAEIEKADFTLKDLKGKKWTLSELRGKVVLVNFWATWCAPCRVEMGDLDRLSTYFDSQGLVVLSVTDEDGFKVNSMLAGAAYHPTILLDPGGSVHKLFHIEGIPRTFLFGRDGKLLAVAIDQRTMRQFLTMLGKTDLHN
jgi:thiol-disulfide isomerase/thioredoxin